MKNAKNLENKFKNVKNNEPLLKKETMGKLNFNIFTIN